MDRTQRVDKKSGIISPFITFTPRVMVIKMSKMSHFFVSSDDEIIQFGQNNEVHLNHLI